MTNARHAVLIYEVRSRTDDKTVGHCGFIAFREGIGVLPTQNRTATACHL